MTTDTDTENPDPTATPKRISARDIKVTQPRRPDEATGTDPTPSSGHAEAGNGVEGEGAPEAVAPAVTNQQFVTTLLQDVPAGASALVCSKPGDPSKGGWSAAAAGDIDKQCPPDRNNYFNCSSFQPDAGGSFRAFKDGIAAVHVLVIDDVGTKVHEDLVAEVRPSYRLETSPGNFQLGFRFDPPVTDLKVVEALQSSIAAAGLSDRGALGANRWMRLPKAINGKAKHRGPDGAPFDCRLTFWDPAICYTADQLRQELLLNVAAPSAELPSDKTGNVSGHDPWAEQVYVPRPTQNPVIAALTERGFYKRQLGERKHDITCPWVHEHTGSEDSGAAYFEPDRDHPNGGFRCHHSHAGTYGIRHVLDFAGIDAATARHKPKIRVVNGEINAAVDGAEQEVARTGKYFQAGNLIVSLRADPTNGDVVTVPADEPELTRVLAEQVDWERWDEARKRWSRYDPPARHVHILHRASTFRHLPVLSGIARQPFFRESDGELVRTPGYDRVSQRFGAFDPLAYPLPEPTHAEAIAALGRLDALLDEFHFASNEDRSGALAAMVTAVVRPSLRVAPAFNITAPNSGSGKSYLCSIIVAFAGPGDSMRVSYPVKSEEATKMILALLLQQPAVIEFDDMTGDWIPHGVINRMITNPTISDRVLSVSKAATVSTRSLVIGSGNNIEPLRDLRRRVLTIGLDPPPDLPHFKGRPADLICANRGAYVADVLTIVRAYKAAGSPPTAVRDVAGFDAWADFARQPLMWLSRADPAASLLEQVRHDPDRDFLGALMVEWQKRFGDRPTKVRTSASYAETPAGADLLDVLEQLYLVQRGEIDRNRFGHYLRKNADRTVDGLRFERTEGSERLAWRLVPVGERTV